MNQPVKECDYWVVFDDIPGEETVLCPSGHVLLITGEPPSVKQYDNEFLHQFSKIITCHKLENYPNVIHRQQALPWMVGWYLENGATVGYSKDYDELKNITEIKKEKLLSVISSNKSFTAGHKERLLFIQKLKTILGDQVDVFGRGIREIGDKRDAIAPYKYHIVIENSSFMDYWTEKLADCFLAGAYPLYYGCPNLGDYFNEESFSYIDIHNIEKAIQTIKDVIKNGSYEKKVGQIYRAREKILDEYNFFPMIYQICTETFAESEKAVPITLRPFR
jgi:hypothetical protein